MFSKGHYGAGLIILSALFLIIHCSSKEKSTTPVDTSVEMTGQITFVDGIAAGTNEVTISLGAITGSLDNVGAFKVKGNAQTPGLAMACDQIGHPLLMAVVSSPQKDLQFDIDVHSTAISLAFLSPFVCISDPAKASEVVDRLESLPELTEFEALLTDKLLVNRSALAEEDSEIDDALSNVILAYVNSYPSSFEVPPQSQSSSGPAAVATSLVGGPTILPSYEKSGLTLSWVGGNTYELTNAYGRWVYCCTPQDTFFVFPNGDFLDCLKGVRPWLPSKRRFNMEVAMGDTEEVNLYSYGFNRNPANSWDSLEHDEQTRCNTGGGVTIVFELSRHVLSVITNSSKLAGNDKLAGKIDGSLLGFIFSDAAKMHKVSEYIKANNPWGLAWWMTKEILQKVATSASYREFYMDMTGIYLTDGMVKTLASYLAVPARLTILFDKVTSLLKTAMALDVAYFKTQFEVWKEVEAFGNVEGYVGNKISGNPIEGATVKLAGDDGNPLNSPHEKTTSASGYYRFDNIGVGEKSITVTKTGYRSKSEGVTVVENQTARVDFALEQGTGGLTGRVLNEIFVQNQKPSTLFPGTTDLEANEIGGNHRQLSDHAFDGAYTWNLPPGTWWLVAGHEDYKRDSFQVTISDDANINAPRDLMLKPDQHATATISLDMNNDGQPEQTYTIEYRMVGLKAPTLYDGGCHYGGQPMMTMALDAIRGSSDADYDQIGIGFNSGLITGANQYAMGGFDYYGCSGLGTYAAAAYITTRAKCNYDQANYPMVYSYSQDPDLAGCNCGIPVSQSLYLTNWGTELADTVAGGFNIKLAGSKTCYCGGDDTDGDGITDHWTVSCATVSINFDFRLFVGTDYLVAWKPTYASPKPEPSVSSPK